MGEGERLEVYVRKDGLYDWRKRDGNKQTVATSGGQGFAQRHDVLVNGGVRSEYHRRCPAANHPAECRGESLQIRPRGPSPSGSSAEPSRRRSSQARVRDHASGKSGHRSSAARLTTSSQSSIGSHEGLWSSLAHASLTEGERSQRDTKTCWNILRSSAPSEQLSRATSTGLRSPTIWVLVREVAACRRCTSPTATPTGPFAHSRLETSSWRANWKTCGS